MDVRKALTVACIIEAGLIIAFAISLALLLQPNNIITVYYEVKDVQGANVESWSLVHDKLILIMKDGRVRVESIPLEHHIHDLLLYSLAQATLLGVICTTIIILFLKFYSR